MKPIVDRLETEFDEQIVVDRRNAASEEGKATMVAYNLRAHPSYVVVAPSGEVLWTATGQLTEELLRKQVQTYASTD